MKSKKIFLINFLFCTLILLSCTDNKNSNETKNIQNEDSVGSNELTELTKADDEASRISVQLSTLNLTKDQFNRLASIKEARKIILQFSFSRSKIVNPILVAYSSANGRKRILNAGNPETLTKNQDSGILLPPFILGDQEVKIKKLRDFIEAAIKKDADFADYRIVFSPVRDETFKDHIKFKISIITIRNSLGGPPKQLTLEFTTNPSPPKGAEDEITDP